MNRAARGPPRHVNCAASPSPSASVTTLASGRKILTPTHAATAASQDLMVPKHRHAFSRGTPDKPRARLACAPLSALVGGQRKAEHRPHRLAVQFDHDTPRKTRKVRGKIVSCGFPKRPVLKIRAGVMRVSIVVEDIADSDAPDRHRAMAKRYSHSSRVHLTMAFLGLLSQDGR